MKRSIAKKWIAALRGGKYKQGTGQLYNATTDSYCCLGVLADLHGSLDKKTKGGCVNNETIHWAGMIDGRSETRLVHENDHERSSFYDISCIIEDYWEEL